MFTSDLLLFQLFSGVDSDFLWEVLTPFFQKVAFEVLVILYYFTISKYSTEYYLIVPREKSDLMSFSILWTTH